MHEFMVEIHFEKTHPFAHLIKGIAFDGVL